MNNLPINPTFQPSPIQIKHCQNICIYIIDRLITYPGEVCKYTTPFGFEIAACIIDGLITYYFSPYYSEMRQVIAAIFDDFNKMLEEKKEKKVKPDNKTSNKDNKPAPIIKYKKKNKNKKNNRK